MSLRNVVDAWVFLFAFLCMISMVSCNGAMAQTLFQTSIDSYDPRIDLRTNGVMIHRHGADPDSVAKTISSWQGAGYDVYRMWFIGSDAGKVYVDGKFDGQKHYDEIETGAGNQPFYCGDRPYMVPTEGWNRYMEEFALGAVRSGAVGIAPEEPLAHTGAGYSPAFKREWEAFYGEPWVPPHSSVEAFWKASKLKSYLYLRSVGTVLDAAKGYAAQLGRDVKFILPTHSLVSHASGNMIYPCGETFYLKGLDGFVGQVWTGPIGWSLGKYEGKQLTRDTGFFESAWILYSYFANLVAHSDKRMYLLADPVEDDPNYRWDQYHIWYNQSLVAKLMFPWVADYEVMPWPERIFLPGYGTGGGTPGPESYLTQLTVNVAALSDMENQQGVSWDAGTQGIGVPVGDTLGWQRGGPSGSSMDSLNGLVLPLLRKGIPVQILPIERICDEGYLDEYRVLLLSYDMWKPLRPDYHLALAEWVRRGGVLVFFEGDDPYHAVNEWWRRAGYDYPAEHLFRALGLKADIGPDASARGSNDGSSWTMVLKADRDYHNLENRRIYTVNLDRFLPAEEVLVRFRDGSPADGWGPWLARVELRIARADGSLKTIRFQCNNGPEEQKYLASVGGPGGVDSVRRFADADGWFTYKFPLGNAKSAELRLDLGNNFVVELMPVTKGVGPSAETLLPSFDEPIRPIVEGMLRSFQEKPFLMPKLTYCSLEEDRPVVRAGLVRPIGRGHLIYLGIPAATFANSPIAAEALRKLVRYATDKLAGVPYRESGYMVLRRGNYMIARCLEGAVTLQGDFVDLLDSRIPLVKEVRMGPGDSALLFDASSLLKSKKPVVIYGSHEVIDSFNYGDRTVVVSAGPWQTRGVVRIFAGTDEGTSSGPVRVEAYAIKGFGPPLQRDEVNRDVLVKAACDGELRPVDLTWQWDSSRRTLLVNFQQWHSGVLISIEWGKATGGA